VDDLQSLITRRLGQLAREGVTAAEVIRRAARAGHRVSKATLSRHGNGALAGRMPTAEVITGLATGLGLPLAEVADAALRSTGVPMPARNYGSTDRPARVRGVCSDCTTRPALAFDELVVVVPHVELTKDEIEELRVAVECLVTRQMERRTRPE
jgi:hypothetical protein